MAPDRPVPSGPWPEPDTAAGWKARGDQAARRGQLREAMLSYERAVELDAALADAWAALGAARMNAGRADGPDCLERALRLEPDHKLALRNKSVALEHAGRHAEALAVLDRLGWLDPGNPEVWKDRALMLFALGRFVEAHASSLRALDLDRRHAAAWELRVECEIRLSRFRDALRSLRTRAALGLPGDRVEGALKLGAFLAGRIPGNPRYFVGMQLLVGGRAREALEALGEAVAAAPDWPEAWADHGEALAALSHPQEALASFERAAALDPSYPPAWERQARVLALLGRLAEAGEALRRGLGGDPGKVFGEALRPRVAEALLGRPEALVEAARQLAPSAPPPPRPVGATQTAEDWKTQADAHLARGDRAAAMRCYKTAVEKDRRLAAAWVGLAVCYGKARELEQALGAFDKALELEPGSPAVLREKARALIGANRWGSALEALEKALGRDPTDAEAAALLEQCRRKGR
ncbi:MAG: tetratricopeptide repeat protein [Elusimicrobia bacterium]|nr:tetratricopeptide repeat protein [Elusimicrobiota bacterium]